MKTIAVILPYFGKFPNYFQFFLQSCRDNPTVDFHIITDNDSRKFYRDSGSNIHFHETTFEEVKDRFQDIFPFGITLNRPYKLCDFKPVYGMAFQDIVQKYDFWGYCDCDLIFGNIRRFLTDDILDKYDYILGLGHFHIQRTSDEKFGKVLMNARTRDGHDYEYVFSHERNYVLDELPSGVPYAYMTLYPERFYSGFHPSGRDYDSLSNQFLGFVDMYNFAEEYKNEYLNSMYFQYEKDISIWHRALTDGGKKDVIYDYKKGLLQRWYNNENGGVECAEVLYVHFFRRPLLVKTSVADSFTIVPNKIIRYQDVINSSVLKRHNSLFVYFILHIESIKRKILKKFRLK